MGKRKPLPLLEDVQFTSVGAEGNAVARVDDMVLFVPMLIPGDIADIRVRRRKKKYMEGELVCLKQPSPDRTGAVCRHFGICGGCKWQHMPYELQLKWKARQVFDSLTRLGRIEMEAPPPIRGASDIYRYRNKLEYTFSSRRWLTRDEIASGDDFSGSGALGFHIPGYFDKVLDIEECHLQDIVSDRIRNSLRGFALSRGISFFDPVSHAGLLRNLIVRTATTGEIMVVVVFRSDEEEITGEVMGFLARTFPEVTSLMYIINEKKNDSLHDREPVLYSGNDHITEVIEGLRFRVGAKSFYQTNPAQARVLYEVARDFTGLQGEGVVYDLYCGTGTISCFVAERASKVIGIEYIAEAVNDARENALMNQIENASFFTGDIKDLLTASFFETNGSPDVVITDPPRAGMHAGVVAAIAEAAPGVIVYVSCNPATQARDILLLSDRYRVDAVQAVDMFPHTHHIENVVRLVRIDAGAGKSGGIVI